MTGREERLSALEGRVLLGERKLSRLKTTWTLGEKVQGVEVFDKWVGLLSEYCRLAKEITEEKPC